MKLLMLAVLAFAPMQQQTDPCLMAPANVSPPVATECLPPGIMDWGCVQAADERYKQKMARAFRLHCYRVQAILAQYDLDRFECNMAYDTCVYNGTPPAECETIRASCLYNAGQTAVTDLDAADAAKAAAEASAAAFHAGETAACCQQE